MGESETCLRLPPSLRRPANKNYLYQSLHIKRKVIGALLPSMRVRATSSTAHVNQYQPSFYGSSLRAHSYRTKHPHTRRQWVAATSSCTLHNFIIIFVNANRFSFLVCSSVDGDPSVSLLFNSAHFQSTFSSLFRAPDPHVVDRTLRPWLLRVTIVHTSTQKYILTQKSLLSHGNRKSDKHTNF